jgi:hypothetical protein
MPNGAIVPRGSKEQYASQQPQWFPEEQIPSNGMRSHGVGGLSDAARHEAELDHVRHAIERKEDACQCNGNEQYTLDDRRSRMLNQYENSASKEELQRPGNPQLRRESRVT